MNTTKNTNIKTTLLFGLAYNEGQKRINSSLNYELDKIKNNDFSYWNTRCKKRLNDLKNNRITVEQFKKSLVNCYGKDAKNLADKLLNGDFNFEGVENSTIDKIELSIEWVKSSVWGYNPHCDAKIFYKNENGYRMDFYKGTASGCGYDKESASVASALNQSRLIKKYMYEMKENALKEKKFLSGDFQENNTFNRELFGYGSGYGILPYFEGGVGMSSTCNVIENLGFKKISENHAKHCDFYVFTKK